MLSRVIEDYSNTRLLGAFPDSLFCLLLYRIAGDSSYFGIYLGKTLYFKEWRKGIFHARPPPGVFGETDDFLRKLSGGKNGI